MRAWVPPMRWWAVRWWAMRWWVERAVRWWVERVMRWRVMRWWVVRWWVELGGGDALGNLADSLRPGVVGLK